MRYGYYVPSLNQRFGDEELSIEAESMWRENGTPPPQRFEGTSIWERAGVRTISSVFRNFFTGKNEIRCEEFLFLISMIGRMLS